MLKELSVVLVGDDRELGNILEEVRKIKMVPIHFELVSLANLKNLLSKVQPHLIIYETDGNAELVGKTAQNIASEFSHLRWAIASRHNDTSMVVKFFRMGAMDFLLEPVQPDDMRRLIQKIVDFEGSHQTNGNGHKDHRMYGFFSNKGGVGLTTLAANTAVELASRNRGSVLLLDLVLQHGNVTDLLDVIPKYTITDLIENFDRLDANLIENSLTKHSSGLYVLPCPRQPEDEDFLTANQATEIFGFLKSTFQYVIADLGHEFSKPVISYLDLSDSIFVATTPDVPSLCNTRNALAVFTKLGYDQAKVKVILNRWKMKGEIDFSLIQKNFPMEVFTKIPDDISACLNAANQGKALTTIAKKAEITRSIEKMMTDILKIEQGNAHVAQRKA